MHTSDDLFLGAVAVGARGLGTAKNPTQQIGVGPMGRVFVYDVVPAAIGTANIAALQALTINTPMTLAAGAGITLGVAPDGSGAAVYQLDIPRAISLTNTTNQSAINVTVVGYDNYGQKMSQVLAAPNNTTVNTLKAFASVLSVTPNATNAGTMSVGTSDTFGLPFALLALEYIISQKWANTSNNPTNFTGTVTFPADTTNPATSATGDVRGTVVPGGSASNGVRRLAVAYYLNSSQCGAFATAANAIGVTNA